MVTNILVKLPAIGPTSHFATGIYALMSHHKHSAIWRHEYFMHDEIEGGH